MNDSKYYKVKGIKVFGSKENLYGNQKRYRKVFEEYAAKYIYCEFSFFNKLFDDSDWEAKIKFVCTEERTGEVLCELKRNIFISKERNTVFVREGWGTPESGWWKPGFCKWEVYFNDDFVGMTRFYVISGGPITLESNPYFNLNSIKLFESSSEGLPFEDRIYLTKFNHSTTRYLNVELSLDNITKDLKEFPLEIQFNFFNNEGMLKANMSYFKIIKNSPEEIILDTGYGSTKGGYWFKGNYLVEVLFMDQIIASTEFVIGEKEEYGNTPLLISSGKSKQAKPSSPLNSNSFKKAQEELEQLIGLTSVKKQINDLAVYLKFLKIRKDQGLEKEQPFNLNTIFSGNPGTGKTTVAKMLGNIYNQLGLLTHGKVLEVGRAELVGEFIGQTAPKVKKLIEKARGGVLFIDEAYSLTNRGDDGKDFGREVIEVLIKEMSDGPGDLAIICAGYPKEMENFLDSNPGLKSRIKRTIQFPDYTPDELLKIADFVADKRDVTLAKDAKSILKKRLTELYRKRDEQFGNARYINGVLEEAKQNMAIRLMEKMESKPTLTPEFLSTIQVEDIDKVFASKSEVGLVMPIDEELLTDALSQLHELVGLNTIKSEIDEMVKLVRYYREIGKNIKKAFSLHTVFTGNSGTGKTTVARLIIQIYKALGVLDKGHLVECDRKDMVAGFVGQTADKTSNLVKKALGGGLFIDEAYALANGGDNDFGREAIETLLKLMEDHRGEFVVIAAGYPDEMKTFLEVNPGLMSRFDKNYHFEDYNAENLMLIAKMMFDKEELRMDDEGESVLTTYIQKLLDEKHRYFGNARTIRKVVANAIKRQNLRMADVPHKKREWLLIHTVIKSDLADVEILESNNSRRKAIGF